MNHGMHQDEEFPYFNGHANWIQGGSNEQPTPGEPVQSEMVGQPVETLQQTRERALKQGGFTLGQVNDLTFTLWQFERGAYEDDVQPDPNWTPLSTILRQYS